MQSDTLVGNDLGLPSVAPRIGMNMSKAQSQLPQKSRTKVEGSDIGIKPV